jgi:DNA-binding response OmpR family regulator
METEIPNSPGGVPPIVLLVEDDADTRDLYQTALGFAGLWVAQAADADDALEYAIDLRPDAVLMDIALPAAGDGLGLARALRESTRFSETPIVAVTGLEPRKVGGGAELFSAIFYKPVRLTTLVRRVKWLSLKSSVLRERSTRARARVPHLVAKSTELLNRSARIGERRLGLPGGSSDEVSLASTTVRTCPKCRKPLLFSEQRTLDGTTFDYYSPCRNGCGLFCYDHSRRTMVTLVG